MTYDAASVRTYFDTFGEREWERLETTLQGRSNYAVHNRFLDEHTRPGMTVLDIGSGPGRFAIDLIASGADVTLADVSTFSSNSPACASRRAACWIALPDFSSSMS